MDSLNDNERAELASIITEEKPDAAKTSTVEHKFVKDWKMEDLQPSLDQVSQGVARSEKAGRLYTSMQCVPSAIGSPMRAARWGRNSTAEISSRFKHCDILESIIEPSKVISEQYQNTVITKKDGDDVTGRVVEENDQRVVVVTNPLTQTKVEVAKAEIQKRQRPSKISPMPEGLVNNLTKEEILDLIAYLESGGKETAAAFRKN